MLLLYSLNCTSNHKVKLCNRARLALPGSRAMCVVACLGLFLFLGGCAKEYSISHDPWDQVFGGFETDRFYDIIETPDNGVVVVGSTVVENNFEVPRFRSELLAVKLSSDGELVWENAYRGLGEAMAYGLATDDRGNIYVSGTTERPGKNEFQRYLLKLNKKGKPLWENYSGGPRSDSARKPVVAKDGSLFLVGSAVSEERSTDGWVGKYSSDGNLEWERTFGGQAFDVLTDGVVDDEGHLLVSGQKGSLASGSDIWTIKLEPSGEVIWEQVLDEGGLDGGRAVALAKEGGYLISGYKNRGDRKSLFVAKLSSAGKVLWKKGDYDIAAEEAVSIEPNPDGGYYLFGTAGSLHGYADTNGGFDAWVGSIDESGALTSSQVFGGNSDDQVGAGILSRSGNLIICGETDVQKRRSHRDWEHCDRNSLNSCNSDAWVKKLSSINSN